MRKKLKRAVFLSVLLAGILGVSVPAYAEGEESRIITKSYETLDKQDTGDGQFELQFEEDGYVYELRNVNVRIVEEKLIQDPMVYESPFFLEDPDGYYPEEVMQDDSGNAYVLLETELKEKHQEAHEEYGDATITYEKEYIDKIEGDAAVEIEDRSSGEKVISDLPLIESEIVNEYWVDDFVFPITISDYDAEAYLLGDVYVPRGVSLVDYKDEFLSYLGLPASYYRIDGIDWDGEAYVEGGIVKRDAVAWGSKMVQEVVAVYGGTVVLEEKDGYVYESLYREMTEAEIEAGHPIEGEGYMYVMEAEAEYELIKSPSFWDKLQEIWEQIMIWIKEHPVESACLLLLALVIIILLILSRKKKKEEEEETDEELLRKEGLLPEERKER